MDDDELLACYLDGELDETQAIAFEGRLAAEPVLAEKLASWRENDAVIARDLEALLHAAPAPPVPALQPAPPVVDLATWRTARDRTQPSRFAARRWALPSALAASLAVVGLFTIPLLRQSQPGPLDALDHLPAGQSLALADGTELTAVLTFAAADGRWCREYAISGQGNAIACREDGAWRSHGDLTGDETGPAATGEGYATAAGASPAALEEVYAELGAGDPMGMADEAALIENGWTNPVD